MSPGVLHLPKLIALRKQEAVLTWRLPRICCQTALYCGAIVSGRANLLVIANLSREIQPRQPKMLGNWQLVMHNYEEASPQPCTMTLRPLSCLVVTEVNLR